MSTTPPDDAEVIELANHREGAEPKLRVLRASSCFCSFAIDKQMRTVTCKRCGRTWDPFDALIELARSWTLYAANRTALADEVKRLTEKRDRLRKDVQNLKAQARRADKGPTP